MLTRILYHSLFLLLLFIIGEKTQAQVCTSHFSDPTVSIDFGSGAPLANPIPQVPAGYVFSPGDCPATGHYSVRNSSFQCFNNLWQVLPFDHTPNDVNGNFLLINALGGPTDVFIDTVSLCSGLIFEAGAWFSNLVNPFSCTSGETRPDLTLSVYSLTGTLIASYNTGEILALQPAGWTNYRFRFAVPIGSGDVVFKITDKSFQGCGNDFAIDDISFSPCAGDVKASFSNTVAPEIAICEEKQVNYILTSSYVGYASPLIQWQFSTDGNNFTDIPGANGTTFIRTPTPWGIYYYRFSIYDPGSASCKVNSNIVKIDVSRSPFAQGVNYVYGCFGSTVTLGSAGGSFYHWIGPNGFDTHVENPSIPNVDFDDAGTYIVQVTTTEGCSAYDTTDLKIYLGPAASVAFAEHAMCQGHSVQLSAIVDPTLRYRWSPAEGLSNDTISNPVASPLETTTYIVKVFNETITCYDTASVKVIVWENPKVDAGPDKFTYNQKPVLLVGVASGSGINYSWSPPVYLSSSLSLRPTATPVQTTTYTLAVTSSYGCGTVTDTVTVKVIDSLLIPTAFTPNHDGLNDSWEIITFTKYPQAIVEVYNRWGERVYGSTGSNYKPWDGKFRGQPADPGAYVYYVRLRKNAEVIKGILNLIE
jgi:gliding motility-associated-like protein